MQVLILEDEEQSQKALERILGECSPGIRILKAQSFGAAKTLLEKSRKIDLFLLDVNLGGEETNDILGFAFAEEIRKKKEYSFTPIVMVTSVASLEMEAYRKLHCYQYLTKPFEKKDVEEVVKKVLENVKERSCILVKKDGINYKIFCDSIVFIKAIPRGVCIYMKKEKMDVLYLSLKQILEKLQGEDFLQCHRMYVVNKMYMEYCDVVNQIIKMRYWDETVEIGVTYKAQIRRVMNER